MSSPSPYQAQLDLAKVIVVRRSSRFIGLTSTSFLFCRLPQSAALKAGEIIASYSSVGRSSNSARVDVKSGVDLVTEADTRVEKVVISMIRDAYPNDVIVGEEDQAVTPLGRPGEEFPSDRNICYPFCAVSIGYMSEGEPRVGVVYNPFTESMYEAAQGSGLGTLLNGKPVRVDGMATSVQDCLLVNNVGHIRSVDFVDESTQRINRWLRAGLRGYRSSGSAAQNMAHVATGQVSCYYEHGFGGPWDVCAGIVLVKEAGGVVFDARHVEGVDLKMNFGKGSVCAGSRKVCEDVLRTVELDPEGLLLNHHVGDAPLPVGDEHALACPPPERSQDRLGVGLDLLPRVPVREPRELDETVPPHRRVHVGHHHLQLPLAGLGVPPPSKDGTAVVQPDVQFLPHPLRPGYQVGVVGTAKDEVDSQGEEATNGSLGGGPGQSRTDPVRSGDLLEIDVVVVVEVCVQADPPSAVREASAESVRAERHGERERRVRRRLGLGHPRVELDQHDELALLLLKHLVDSMALVERVEEHAQALLPRHPASHLGQDGRDVAPLDHASRGGYGGHVLRLRRTQPEGHAVYDLGLAPTETVDALEDGRGAYPRPARPVVAVGQDVGTVRRVGGHLREDVGGRRRRLQVRWLDGEEGAVAAVDLDAASAGRADELAHGGRLPVQVRSGDQAGDDHLGANREHVSKSKVRLDRPQFLSSLALDWGTGDGDGGRRRAKILGRVLYEYIIILNQILSGFFGRRNSANNRSFETARVRRKFL
ncbi:hypothetical protein THAOC_15744 [Thalassiosira oceanica]|uniref:Inositol-1-monophosphatase n=1 Tax=Thalassiosira oceanica TaxID=159749 RepID=K0SZE4_THAOC|nr:hypothetical protein THAOC_15744 [Thalassiosira oceanica]|eukprot:EJK63587.1 hypothetical protein THAOC_15744 [Thalassiosira oceanica]